MEISPSTMANAYPLQGMRPLVESRLPLLVSLPQHWIAVFNTKFHACVQAVNSAPELS